MLRVKSSFWVFLCMFGAQLSTWTNEFSSQKWNNLRWLQIINRSWVCQCFSEDVQSFWTREHKYYFCWQVQQREKKICQTRGNRKISTEMGRDKIKPKSDKVDVIIKKKKYNPLSNIGVYGLILSGRICFPCLPCSPSNVSRDQSCVLQTRMWAAVTIRYSLEACSLPCHTAFWWALPWQWQEFLWFLH